MTQVTREQWELNHVINMDYIRFTKGTGSIVYGEILKFD